MSTATRLTLLSTVAAGLILLGPGCITIGSGGSNPNADGGIFKSADKGDSWSAKSAIATVSGEKKAFNNASIGVIVQDPQDPNALYVGTAENGMFFTYDSGESWFQPPAITSGRIWSIAIHPKDKCTIFATAGSKLIKSEDCARTWSVPYTDTRANAQTKVVAIDSYNPNNVWLGMSTGDLLVSQDGGDSWSSVYGFNNEIMQVKISQQDTRQIFVATKTAGLWRTDDAGQNWKDLRPGYSQMSGATDFLDLALGISDPKLVIFSSKYGLVRSRDSGDSWDKVNLLTPPGQAMIYSLAVDPKDANTIYYGTSTTFYKTSNGGVNWVTKRLPTSRAATVMKVDDANSSVLWMGVTKFKN